MPDGESIPRSLAEVEADFAYAHGGKRPEDDPALFEKYAKGRQWRGLFWALTDKERAHYEALQRPARDGEGAAPPMVFVEVEDVIQATLPARLKTLGVEGKMGDLESMFLFQCKGFGTPTGAYEACSVAISLKDGRGNADWADVQAVLQAGKSTWKYEPIPGVVRALQALLAMRYETRGTTPRVVDAECKRWVDLRDWLWSETLRTGKGEVLRSVVIPNSEDEDEQERQEVAENWKPSEVIADAVKVPQGVSIGEEDRRLIIEMRRAVIEEEKYMFKLARCISNHEGVKKITFISPSLRHIEVIIPMLRKRGVDVKPILFGDYEWNKVKVDWSEPGAWMTYEQRIASGARLGDEYEVVGVERAKTWEDVVKLLE